MTDKKPSTRPKWRRLTRFLQQFTDFVNRGDHVAPEIDPDQDSRQAYLKLVTWANTPVRMMRRKPDDPDAYAAAKAAVYDRMWPGRRSLCRQARLTRSQLARWARAVIHEQVEEGYTVKHAYHPDKLTPLFNVLRCWPSGVFALQQPQHGRRRECLSTVCPYCHFRRVVDFHRRFVSLADGPMWLHEVTGILWRLYKFLPFELAKAKLGGNASWQYPLEAKELHWKATKMLRTRLKRAGNRGWVRVELVTYLGSNKEGEVMRIVTLSDSPDCIREGDFRGAKIRVVPAATPAEAAKVLVPDFMRYDHGLVMPRPPLDDDPPGSPPFISGAERYDRYYRSKRYTQPVSELWPGVEGVGLLSATDVLDYAYSNDTPGDPAPEAEPQPDLVR
jgi:hypothetical protein